MKKDLFTDGLCHIDVDAVERLLQIEQDMQDRQRRQRRTRLLIIPAAALLALLVCMTVVIIPFIPKTLELDYEPSKGMPERVWVYYVNENGKQKRELVKQPQGAQNVFTSWKHLNTVDNEVQLLDYSVATEPMSSTTVVPNTLWESLLQMLDKDPAQTIVTATLSAQITSCENYDALIESLKQTLAKYAGVDIEQVKILIDGEWVIVPGPSGSDVSGQLKFSYSFTPDYSFAALYYTPGSTIELTVSMTNVSDTDVVFRGSEMAFYPDAILEIMVSDDAIYQLKPQDRQITDEYAEYRLAPGETRTTTYDFSVPEDAPLGAYDLTVSFGEDRVTFNQVITLANFDMTDTDLYAAEFAEFLQKYGFYTTDPSGFRVAVEQLSFSGMDLFDIMTKAQIDYAEGYSGEEHGSQWFSYGYTTLPNGKSNNYFVAKKIPDDMRLPYGITFADTLYHSLCKMGFTDFEAEEIIARLENGDGQLISLGNPPLYLTRDQAGNYVIRYSTLTVLSSSNYPVYTLDIIYSRTEMIAQVLLVKAGVGNFSTDAFTAPINVSYIAQSSLGRELNPEDAQTLIDIFLSYIGTWNSGEVDVDYDYCITSAGKAYLYSTRAGVLADSGGYMGLSNEHRLIVNEIVTKGNYQPNFGSITLAYTDYHVTLPAPIGQYVLHELNSNTWTHESLEATSTLNFICDGTTVGYVGNTLFTAGDYITSDTLTRVMMMSLESALTAIEDGTYDAILYYNGAFYGHNASVDQSAQGKGSFSMNIAPKPLDELLFAYSVPNATDTFGDIVDCKSSDYLITINGQCFERFTDAFPDFAPEYDCQSLKMTFYNGNHCDVDFSDEDAEQISEIFRTIESFGDTIKPGTQGIAELEFNRFPVHVTTTGDIIIGNVVAQGDYDRELLLEILERCYNESNH